MGVLGFPADRRGARGREAPPSFKPDGYSLVAFLKGDSAPKRDSFYWELHEGGFVQAIRFGNWKAVRNGPDKPLELYDLSNDAAETTDLAASKPELVAKAEALMKQARVDDPNWPVAAPKTKPKKQNKKPATTKGVK